MTKLFTVSCIVPLSFAGLRGGSAERRCERVQRVETDKTNYQAAVKTFFELLNMV